MADLRVTHHLDAGDAQVVEALLERVQRAQGHRPVDEQRWVDATAGRVRHAGLLLPDDGDDGQVVAYAQATEQEGTWAIDLAVDPDRRADLPDLAGRLLGAAIDVVAGEGGGEVQWWVHEPTDVHEHVAVDAGLAPGRHLFQMRVPLPLDATTEIATRPFVPGQDEQAWLEVNNAAFAWHPEQGGLALDDVRQRQAEPWFDPDGFLLHERDGRLAGFCWTKLHEDPPVGEIYVIAVHPDFHGHGLGRALTVAGLAHLSSATDTGMLYVDAGNTPAVTLYEDLGFTVHATNRSFVGTVG